LAFIPGAPQQVGHAEVGGPAVEVGVVQPAGVDLQDAEDVAPLALRGLIAEAEPFELEQDNILRRDALKRRPLPSRQRRGPAPRLTDSSNGRSFRTKQSTLKPLGR
jgi:hypothetical protein